MTALLYIPEAGILTGTKLQANHRGETKSQGIKEIKEAVVVDNNWTAREAKTTGRREDDSDTTRRNESAGTTSQTGTTLHLSLRTDPSTSIA